MRAILAASDGWPMLPRITSSSWPASIPASAMTRCMTTFARSYAATVLNPPPKLPLAVRSGLVMTTSFIWILL